MTKILVVDDGPADRDLLTTLLTYARYRVLAAADGNEALQLVKAEHPDLVISDVLLPIMDGYGLVRLLHADPLTAQTPVIFYSAVFNEQEARELARDYGVARLLAKPAEPQAILDAVAEVLGEPERRKIAVPPEDLEQRHQRLLIDKLMAQVEALRQAEAEIRCSRDELEIRVQERTAELEAANQELQVNAERLARLNEELQEFAFVASHDLQEPLRKITTFGSRLETKYAMVLGEDGRDYLTRMTQSAQRMSNLLYALLAYSRVTTKLTPVQPIDLTEVVKAAVSDLEMAIERAGAEVEIGSLPVAEVDPHQMRQLFQNLIANAVKYRRNGEKPKIKVYGRLEDNGCRIFVEDNGIGFEERYLDRVFRPFQRLHSRSEYEGTGMGLAICRKIAERHGGGITAESTPGQGSTFIVMLPPHPGPLPPGEREKTTGP